MIKKPLLRAACLTALLPALAGCSQGKQAKPVPAAPTQEAQQNMRRDMQAPSPAAAPAPPGGMAGRP